jgi:hypothetical protein
MEMDGKVSNNGNKGDINEFGNVSLSSLINNISILSTQSRISNITVPVNSSITLEGGEKETTMEMDGKVSNNGNKGDINESYAIEDRFNYIE